MEDYQYLTYWKSDRIAKIKIDGYKIEIFSNDEETNQKCVINSVEYKFYTVKISKGFVRKSIKYTHFMPVNKSYDFQKIVNTAIRLYKERYN